MSAPEIAGTQEVEHCRIDCLIGIKAFHSLKRASTAFRRLEEGFNSLDFVSKSALFSMGVAEYAKPFLNVQTQAGKRCYQLKILKQHPEFSGDLHDQLVKRVRNKLVSHDDLIELEARLAAASFVPESGAAGIPMSIVASSKAVLYPKTIRCAKKLRKHAELAMDIVRAELVRKLTRHRELSLKYPEAAREQVKYSRVIEERHIPKEGLRLETPDISGEEWLDPDEPDLSEFPGGLEYEIEKRGVKFDGPGIYEWSDGQKLVIKPKIG